MSHKEKAMTLFHAGYNCAQSVFGAFCEELGLDFDTAMRISQSFGGGFGRMREICGAVSGMAMAVGLSHGSCDVGDPQQKGRQYEMVRQLTEKFRLENRSYLCRELLNLERPDSSSIPEPRTDAYYQQRPCAELVGCAAEILEHFYTENPFRIPRPIEKK